MQNLDEIVEEYLKRETDYALMITGEWGSGKTYYFKNTIEPLIKKTKTYKNEQKKYKVIYVSLFGIKSIEDIQAEIFIELHPILKSKTLKVTAGIGKSLLKGVMRLHGIDKYYDDLKEAKIDKGSLLRFDELVICFDDLERLSGILPIEEFIGYINSIIDNEHAKILIIANEGKIDGTKYSEIKEKVVGNTIEFIPDISKLYDSLISSKFVAFPTYLLFLNNKKEFILGYFTPNSTNIRTLSFCLTYFQTIFSEISLLVDKETVLKEKKDEILFNLLKFTLAISIEYRKGEISFKQKNDLEMRRGSALDLIANTQWGRNIAQSEKEKEKSYREQFIEKYYKDSSYIFFKSVYDFITGGSKFKIEELNKELKIFYNIYDNKLSPQYELFNQLYMNSSTLSDSEYKKLTKEMLKYLDKGEYGLESYISIFYLVTRFNNPLHFKLVNLESRIIKGMKKGKQNYKYNSTLDMHLHIDQNLENTEILIRIRTAAIKINDEILEEKITTDYKRLEELFYSNFHAFASEVLDRKTEKYYYEPIFRYFNVNKFYSFFLNQDNTTRTDIISFFKSRYYRIYQPATLTHETEFHAKVKAKLEKKVATLAKSGIKSFQFASFSYELEEILNKLKSKTN